MHSYSEIRHSPYTPAQLYTLVLDIERYPEFLPWCRGARILERKHDYFIGELIISFSHLTERYSSKVTPTPATHGQDARIEVSLERGPFTHLANHWRFEPKDGGTDIHFAVEFEFKSRILDKMMGGFFTRAVEKMGAAFITRADALYSATATSSV